MKTAIVTGGAYGIGRAIARRFADEGYAIVIADLNEERGSQLALSLEKSLFIRTDVRDEVQIQQLISASVGRFGQIDVVCSNAGIESYRRADEYTAADWNNIIDTNLRAAFLIAKYAYPHLRVGRGSLVVTASVQGIANEKHISIYASSKAGLLGLVRGLAIDFAPDGIRVNAVCPGATMTGMMEAALDSEADPQSVLNSISASIPLGRIGAAEDVADAVYFLASEKASYITGTHLVVDGGVLARLAL
jgi:NAD(P)-dependent dehydrogenase (short-subunit alcohol dehydrogenase family)